MINAIIMASGHSKRMGENKLLLPYKGKHLIEHTLDKVVNCGFDHVILVAQDARILALGKNRRMTVIRNTEANKGQSESIKLGIQYSPDALGYVFFTGDQPLIDKATITQLIEQFKQNNDRIIVPYYQSLRGTPVIFPNCLKEELLALEGDTGGRTIIEQNRENVLFVEVDREQVLWDIDTRSEYNQLMEMDDAK